MTLPDTITLPDGTEFSTTKSIYLVISSDIERAEWMRVAFPNGTRILFANSTTLMRDFSERSIIFSYGVCPVIVFDREETHPLDVILFADAGHTVRDVTPPQKRMVVAMMHSPPDYANDPRFTERFTLVDLRECNNLNTPIQEGYGSNLRIHLNTECEALQSQ